MPREHQRRVRGPLDEPRGSGTDGALPELLGPHPLHVVPGQDLAPIRREPMRQQGIRRRHREAHGVVVHGHDVLHRREDRGDRRFCRGVVGSFDRELDVGGGERVAVVEGDAPAERELPRPLVR